MSADGDALRAAAAAAGAGAPTAAWVDDDEEELEFADEPFSGTLGLLETLSIAWRSIVANLSRSVLTTLGVIIGVAAVVALTAVGAGVTRNVTDNLTALGTNLLTVTSNTLAGAGAGAVRMGGAQTVTVGDAEAIRALGDPRVAGIAPTLQSNLQVRAGPLNTSASVVGTWADYAGVRNSGPAVGDFFTELDEASRRSVAVLGHEIAQELFPGGDAVGRTISISNQSYTVVGVLPDKGNTGFQSPNRQVLVPLSTYLRRIGRQAAVGRQTVQSIVVQARRADELSELEADLTSLLAERRGALDPETFDFRLQNQADTLASFDAISTALALFLGSIAGISLVVGGIGIMNIMLVSVTERTREIGIRKALGAKPRSVLSQFLLEAIVLSVGGGVIGMAIGVGGAFVVGPLVGIRPALTPAPMVLAFLFSLAVGVFFGFYPAKRAARLDAVESLRHE